MKRVLLLLTTVGIGVNAWAQDSLATRVLEEVVFTGQYEPQSARKSVYQVRTISHDRIQAQGATRLQDILNHELNIRFSQDLALGGSNLTLQGLAGQNVKVLLDGVPITGRQGTGNEININQIDVNTIERIEIVEGPMSVTYGADALAGVINIITRKPAAGQLSAYARLHEETVGKEYSGSKGIHQQSVGASYAATKGWEWSLQASRNDFGGWQGSAAERDKQWHPKLQWQGAAMAGYRSQRVHAYYRLDALHEDIYNPDPFIGNVAFDQHYITKRFMHQAQSEARFSSRLTLNNIVSYTDYNRRTRSTNVNKTTGAETLALGDGMQDVTAFQAWALRGTATYRLNSTWSFQPGYDINLETGSGGRIKAGDQTINDYAAFVSAEWNAARWRVRPGLRFMYNSVYNAPPAVPSLNIKYQIGPRMDVMVSYGRGFRAPSIRELYFNFFDASHQIEGNPDLKAERSHSLNAAYQWQVHTSAAFSLRTQARVFYNDVKDQITTGYKAGSATVTTYLNVDRFKTQGGTWESSAVWKGLEATVGFSYTGRYNQYRALEAALPDFTWSEEVNASLAYTFKPSKTQISAYYKYTGKLPVYELSTDGTARLATLSAYTWADVSVQQPVGKWVTLTAGARNLFNVVAVNNTSTQSGAHAEVGPRPIGYGRSYFITAAFRWTKS